MKFDTRIRKIVMPAAIVGAISAALFSLWVAVRSMSSACCDPKAYAALPDGGLPPFASDFASDE